VAVAAIDEILGFRRVLPDHRPLGRGGLIAAHAGLVPTQEIGQYCAVGDIGRRNDHRWISLLRLGTLKCAFMPKYHWLPVLL
jgi:hypothetical protein